MNASTSRMVEEVLSPICIDRDTIRASGFDTEVAATFARHRSVALDDLFAPAFFEKLMRICGTAEFELNPSRDGAGRLWETRGIAGRAIQLSLGRPQILRWLETVTRCGTLRSTYGNVLETPPRSHDLDWHDDLFRGYDDARRLGITINFSERPYEGGLFELRAKGSAEVLMRHRHQVPGSVLIFEVSPDLEHRVHPVTAGGPRRVYTGWFRSRVA